MKTRGLENIKYRESWDQINEKDSTKKHALNVKACLDAVAFHNQQGRPLNILLIHGSSRSSFKSAVQQLSNSQSLLRYAIEPWRRKSGVEITEVALKEYNIEACKGCYSSSSVLCGFPCSCFPWDPMQELYPLVLKCDVMLCSTGVNAAALSSRLKTFLDRLISLDGGFFGGSGPPESQGEDWQDKCLALAVKLLHSGRLPYDARMWCRTAAYFITSKDENDSWPISYIELVAHSLREGNANYGFIHDPQNWYAAAWANAASNPRFIRKARLVAKAAIDLAFKLRKEPVPFDGGARTYRG